MDSLSDYQDKKRLDDIINEIIELKYDKSQDNKLKIQKLQQEMIATKVKSIEYDEFGMPIINGRPACTFRLVPNPR